MSTLEADEPLVNQCPLVAIRPLQTSTINWKLHK